MPHPWLVGKLEMCHSRSQTATHGGQRTVSRARLDATGRERRALPGATRPTTSTRRQGLLRVDRLAVVADLEVDHVAVRTGAAHLGDLLTGLHALPFIHQALAVV